MIAVIDYGIGNLGSAHKALLAIGAESELVDCVRDLDGVTGVVLPGVGSFGACVNAIRSTGLEYLVLSAIERGIPLLGICVGMQMLYAGSEESPEVAGLGILNGYVRKLTNAPKLPHMTWDQVELLNVGEQSLLLDNFSGDEWFYFVHSYAPEVTTDTLAFCEFGNKFTAIVGRDNIFGTQFHPEKSSKAGLKLLENFSNICRSKVDRS